MIINRGMTKDSARFRGVVNAMQPDTFSGAIDAQFSARISNRWGPVDGQRITPARKVFRKENNSLKLPRSPRQRMLTLANYSFLTTLQLALAFELKTSAGMINVPPAHLLNHVDLLNLLDARTVTAIHQRLEPDRPATRLFARESLDTFRLLRELIVANKGQSVLSPPINILIGRSDSRKTSGPAPGGALRAGARFGFSRSEARRAPFSKRDILHWAIWPNKTGAANLQYSASIVTLRSILGLINTPAHTLLLRDYATRTRTDKLVAYKEMKLMLFNSSTTELELRPARNSFPELRMTLITQAQADRQSSAQSNSQFTNAPLQYANRDGQLAKGLAKALGEMRQSTSEVKPTAPAHVPRMEEIARQVYDQFKREIRIEKERRGL